MTQPLKDVVRIADMKILLNYKNTNKKPRIKNYVKSKKVMTVTDRHYSRRNLVWSKEQEMGISTLAAMILGQSRRRMPNVSEHVTKTTNLVLSEKEL